MRKNNSLALQNQNNNRTILKKINRYKIFYLFALPGLLYITIFKILPILGMVMSFQIYIPWQGFFKSEWIGLANFKDMFTSEDFYMRLRNSLIINSYKILFGFPIPILFALLLNEIRVKWFKKLVQTVSYFPYFISWTIVSGILYSFLNYNYGILNEILKQMGFAPIGWYQEPGYWRFIVVASSIWKCMGYSSIIYLAAIAGINQELYEAAIVDGAGRLKRAIHITIPGMIPSITVMFILGIGGMISGDFAQIQALMGENNGALFPAIDILETYTFRIYSGRIDLLSYGVAIGMVQSIIAFALIYGTNKIVRKYNEYSLW